MVFSSPIFLFAFLPVVYAVYHLIRPHGAKNVVLLLFSLVFYGFGQPVYILLLLASVFCNYLFGLALSGSFSCRRALLAAAVTVNVAALCVFKYLDFAIYNINAVFGAGLEPAGITLPIGISFFTFQGLSYVIDVYRSKELGARSLLKVALYISFFPQLIAGPIIKYHDVSAQIDSRVCSVRLAAEGIRRFILGLSKKLLIANTVGAVADAVFALEASGLDARAAWLGAICYTLQIYFDFSGYSDMAIGLGKMFGFRFLENFNCPYAAEGMRDFWRRWHISLSTWFRDYLYIPLGGSRRGRVRTAFNRLTVFFLTGLWHGASWNFILWGFWHGAFVSLEGAFGGFLKRIQKNPWGGALVRIVTLLAVTLGFVLFRAETLGAALTLFSAMFAGFAPNPESGFLLAKTVNAVVIIALCAAVPISAGLLPWLEKKFAGGRFEAGASALGFAGTLILLALCAMELAANSFNPFIYFQV